MTSSQPKPPKPQYSFTSFQVNNPTAPPPGDKLDSEYAQTAKVISDVIAWVGTSLNSDGSLKTPPSPSPQTAPGGVFAPSAGGHLIAGADPTALALDWAEVSWQWAEHMPDTIPPNILAVMGITGDHWSSRWWANKAAQAVQYPGYGYGIEITATATLPQGAFGSVNIRNASGAAITIHLPAPPILPGQTLKFKDCLGNAGTYLITIGAQVVLTTADGTPLTDSAGNFLTTTGGTIDGNSSYQLMSDYAALEVFWMGDQWGAR